jgi:hypothetical protein
MKLWVHRSRRDAVTVVGQKGLGPIYTEVQIQGSDFCSPQLVAETRAGPCQIDLHREFATLLSVSLRCNQWNQHKRSMTMNIPPQTRISLRMLAGSLLYNSY